MAEPSPAEWVTELDHILTSVYLPAIMDEVRTRLGPLVRGILTELRPQILRMVQEEVRFQITEETVKRIKITIEGT